MCSFCLGGGKVGGHLVCEYTGGIITDSAVKESSLVDPSKILPCPNCIPFRNNLYIFQLSVLKLIIIFKPMVIFY